MLLDVVSETLPKLAESELCQLVDFLTVLLSKVFIETVYVHADNEGTGAVSAAFSRAFSRTILEGLETSLESSGLPLFTGSAAVSPILIPRH